MDCNSVVQVNQVSKEFQGIFVLQDISFTITSGTICGLVGNNGSGKTVLLKIICGLLKPTKGHVLFKGKEIGREIDYPSNVGAIIDQPGFINHYSGLKNLKLLSSINQSISIAKIIETMKLVGLEPSSKKHTGKYSLGMKQRLGIAQAIMEDQDFLVLDEPMNGLDSTMRKQIRTLLLSLKQQGKTIILTSHNSEDVRILCDEVYLIEDSKLIKL